jgi:hypothetical protein
VGMSGSGSAASIVTIRMMRHTVARQVGVQKVQVSVCCEAVRGATAVTAYERHPVSGMIHMPQATILVFAAPAPFSPSAALRTSLGRSVF